MKISGNQSQTNSLDTKLVKLPLRVNPETIEENGQQGQVRQVRIGAKHHPCIFVEVSERDAHQYMQLEWADVKAEERSDRCLVEDGHGGYIMCPERNLCSKCEKVLHFDFDNHHAVSLDAMYAESEYEPAAPSQCLDFEEQEIMDLLLKKLTHIKPRYGAIFAELLNGTERPSHIAKAVGMSSSQAPAAVDKVRELAADLYFRITK